jgi:diguanylate cyclase (GGDEF)-like protein/PAS domain S-box-containing protein
MSIQSYQPDIYTDIPVPYAVFRVKMNEARTKATDAVYAYVNAAYCELSGYTPDQLIGRSFHKVFADADPMWYTYCYEAVTQGKPVHANTYSREAAHWLAFTVAPIGEDLVAYTFAVVDEERHTAQRVKATDDLIIEISSILNSSIPYDDRINHALAKLGETIQCDRLYVLETDGVTASNTFEWCAEGITPEIDTLQHMPYDDYLGGWEIYLEHDSCVVISDIEDLKAEDLTDYENLKRQGIKRLIGAPFFNRGRLIGYLGSDNYKETDMINIRTVLESVSYFIGAQVINHKLVAALDLASRSDAMTGVFNRNALIEKTDELEQNHISAGVIFADVNGLKQINDRGGHAAGDDILCQAATLLSSHFDRDNVYRMGGDEFVVVLPMIREETFAHTRRRFLNAMDNNPKFRMAVGFAWTSDSKGIEGTIRAADKRMYDNKIKYYTAHDRRRR